MGQSLDVADDAETYVVFHEDLVFERGEHESHEGVYLRLGPVPVLCGEGIEREILHAQPCAFGGDTPYGVHAGLMTVAAVLASLCGPPPVAVHDDGNVLGYACHIKLCHILITIALTLCCRWSTSARSCR